MNVQNFPKPLTWKISFLWMLIAVVCFHLAYTSLKFPHAGLFIFCYALGLLHLANQPTIRRAFYFCLATGYLTFAPQLFFMWTIFNSAAIVLWLILAFWIGLFGAIICGSFLRWGKAKSIWLIPIIWTGIEYFRSELYYLKFSWLNIGYALANFDSNPVPFFGMYGVGFLIFAFCTLIFAKSLFNRATVVRWAIAVLLLALVLPFFSPASSHYRSKQKISITGIQLEYPPENLLPKLLDQALAKNTNTEIFVLSEYTLDGPVPELLKDWCRLHSRFLVVGGKDFVSGDTYYNTAFVVGTNGEVVFKQAKSVPIQFFKDGLRAQKQEVWQSPWGKIGICICYDLSYTRVTDELIRQGAQLLIVPTMDVSEWGLHQHELHERVALERAKEYHVPIFRLASSGISQVVDVNGRMIAQTKFLGNGDLLCAQIEPASPSRPWDRFLAPLCTAFTAVVTTLLLISAWREKRKKRKA